MSVSPVAVAQGNRCGSTVVPDLWLQLPGLLSAPIRSLPHPPPGKRSAFNIRPLVRFVALSHGHPHWHTMLPFGLTFPQHQLLNWSANHLRPSILSYHFLVMPVSKRAPLSPLAPFCFSCPRRTTMKACERGVRGVAAAGCT